jgi:hypothetical protein
VTRRGAGARDGEQALHAELLAAEMRKAQAAQKALQALTQLSRAVSSENVLHSALCRPVSPATAAASQPLAGAAAAAALRPSRWRRRPS